MITANKRVDSAKIFIFKMWDTNIGGWQIAEIDCKIYKEENESEKKWSNLIANDVDNTRAFTFRI